MEIGLRHERGGKVGVMQRRGYCAGGATDGTRFRRRNPFADVCQTPRMVGPTVAEPISALATGRA